MIPKERAQANIYTWPRYQLPDLIDANVVAHCDTDQERPTRLLSDPLCLPLLAPRIADRHGPNAPCETSCPGYFGLPCLPSLPACLGALRACAPAMVQRIKRSTTFSGCLNFAAMRGRQVVHDVSV